MSNNNNSNNTPSQDKGTTSTSPTKPTNVANDINDAMRAFPAYNDGSIFVVMQFHTKLADRLMASDYARFKELLGRLNVDAATLTPEEHSREVDGTRDEIRELLSAYGQDLVDELPRFERSALAMTKGANIFHS
jgi:hypothetical protein